MVIRVVKGTGSGRTDISAFHAGLKTAGIEYYNLLLLSSIIPQGSVVKKISSAIQGKVGDRLYVVMARAETTNPSEEVWAGLGWRQKKGGGGVFVEHVGKSEKETQELIKNSLEDITSPENSQFGECHSSVIGIKCQGVPVCAVVAAVYASEDWLSSKTRGEKI